MDNYTLTLEDQLKELGAQPVALVEPSLMLRNMKTDQKKKHIKAFASGKPGEVQISSRECEAFCNAIGIEYLKGYENRILSYKCSDESSDRHGDVMRARGCHTLNYMKNPVIPFGHDYTQPPVGNTIKLWSDEQNKCVNAWGLFMDERVDTTGRSTLVHRMAQSGFMRACSIGFRPVVANYPSTEAERVELGLGMYGCEYKEWELLEWSPVTVPANANALQNIFDGVDRKIYQKFSREDIDLIHKLGIISDVKIFDIFLDKLKNYTGIVYSVPATKGGPGSGRYPAGSGEGGGSETFTSRSVTSDDFKMDCEKSLGVSLDKSTSIESVQSYSYKLTGVEKEREPEAKSKFIVTASVIVESGTDNARPYTISAEGYINSDGEAKAGSGSYTSSRTSLVDSIVGSLKDNLQEFEDSRGKPFVQPPLGGKSMKTKDVAEDENSKPNFGGKDPKGDNEKPKEDKEPKEKPDEKDDNKDRSQEIIDKLNEMIEVFNLLTQKVDKLVGIEEKDEKDEDIEGDESEEDKSKPNPDDKSGDSGKGLYPLGRNFKLTPKL